MKTYKLIDNIDLLQNSYDSMIDFQNTILEEEFCIDEDDIIQAVMIDLFESQKKIIQLMMKIKRNELVQICVDEEMSIPSCYLKQSYEKYTREDLEEMISANIELLSDNEVISQLNENNA